MRIILVCNGFRPPEEIQQEPGFDRFGVAGHDRGARVAYRMALDRGSDAAAFPDDVRAEVKGRPLAGGHFFPEQNSAETAAELLQFFC